MKVIGNSRHSQGFTYIIIIIFSRGSNLVVLPKQSLIENNTKRSRKKMLICSSSSLLRGISDGRKTTSHVLLIKDANIKHYVLTSHKQVICMTFVQIDY